MRALLDVNVLIALLDARHSLHARARQWFTDHAALGWASCPITQNGCVRIIANPAYANTMPIGSVLERLREACSTPLHAFWPDDISILETDRLTTGRLHGSRQLTDAHLLSLAAHHDRRLVTFDAGIPLNAAPGAKTHHLLTL